MLLVPVMFRQCMPNPANSIDRYIFTRVFVLRELAVVYFLFLITMFVLVVVVTIVIQHLYLRADSVPFTPMSTWVSKRFLLFLAGLYV